MAFCNTLAFFIFAGGLRYLGHFIKCKCSFTIYKLPGHLHLPGYFLYHILDQFLIVIRLVFLDEYILIKDQPLRTILSVGPSPYKYLSKSSSSSGLGKSFLYPFSYHLHLQYCTEPILRKSLRLILQTYYIYFSL